MGRVFDIRNGRDITDEIQCEDTVWLVKYSSIAGDRFTARVFETEREANKFVDTLPEDCYSEIEKAIFYLEGEYEGQSA